MVTRLKVHTHLICCLFIHVYIQAQRQQLDVSFYNTRVVFKLVASSQPRAARLFIQPTSGRRGSASVDQSREDWAQPPSFCLITESTHINTAVAFFVSL